MVSATRVRTLPPLYRLWVAGLVGKSMASMIVAVAHHGDLPGALVELAELYARDGSFDEAIATRY